MKKFYLSLSILTLISASVFTAQAQAPGFAWANQTVDGADIANTIVAVDKQNGFVYEAGYFEGGAINFNGNPISNYNPSSGTDDVFLVKYNLNGGLVWVKTFGGYGMDEVHGLAVDGNGNVYLGGVTDGDTMWFNNGQMAVNPASTLAQSVPNFYLAKIDGNGSTQWVKTGTLTSNDGITQAGNSNVAVDASNNVYIASSVTGSVTFGSSTISGGSGGSMFVLKLDGNGGLIWSAQSTSLTSNLNPGDAIPYAVTIDKDGNCIVAGAFSDDNSYGSTVINTSNDLYFDRFVAKIDAGDGHFIWARGAGVWQGPDVNYGVSSDNSGNVYLTGLLAFPTEGDNSNAYNAQYFIERLNSNGDSSWIATSAFGTSIGNFYIATDGNGNSYLALEINDTAASFGNIHLTIPYPNNFSVPGITLAVVKFDNTGNALWAKTTSGHGLIPITTAGGIALDANNCVYVAGSVEDTANFDSHSLVGNTSESDAFIASTCGSPAGINNPTNSVSDVSIYPNPATNTVQVQWQVTASAQFTITVQNISGQKVMPDVNEGVLNMGSYNAALNLSHLAAGIYFVGLKTTAATVYRKLVIE